MKLRKLTGVLLSVTMLFGGSTAVFADTEAEQPEVLEAAGTEEDTGDTGAEIGDVPAESESGSAGTETEGTGEGSSDSTGSAAENTDSGTDSKGGTESGDSGTESKDSGAESTESGVDSTDSTDGKKEDAGKGEDAADSKKEGTDSKESGAGSGKEDKEKTEEVDDEDKDASSSEGAASTVRRPYISPSPMTITKSEFTLVGKVLMTVSTKEVHLNIRDKRSTEGRIVAKLGNGCTACCLSDPSDEWAYVEAAAQDGTIVRGYCRTDYLVPAPDGTAETPARVIPRCREDGNAAFRDYLTTAQQTLVDRYEVTTTVYGAASGDAAEVIAYGEQFIGTPYVYASESLTGGTDCSGFTQGVFGAFGISLPRTAADQAECGMKVEVSDLVPGDLVFYRSDNSVMDDRAPNGVTHVMIYLGNSQVLHASSSAGQVTISDINLDSVCWGVRILNGSSVTNGADGTGTLLTDILGTAEKAKAGDRDAREAVIELLAGACGEEWQEKGLAPSVMIADAVWSTDWLAGTQAGAPSNNVYDMPAEALDTLWDSTWDRKEADGYRLYDTIEEAVNDRASFKVSLHPYLEGETDVDTVLGSAYAEDKEDLKVIIEAYGLRQYDTVTRTASVMGTAQATADSASCSYDEMEILCATVAQECDSSYEGALAVISCMMNRADMNYGGCGTTAFEQAVATGEWAWDMPGHEDWHDYCIARMRGGFGGIPDHVRQAVSDCLYAGIRSHPYTNMYSSHEKAEAAAGHRISDYVVIGTNCFFD